VPSQATSPVASLPCTDVNVEQPSGPPSQKGSGFWVMSGWMLGPGVAPGTLPDCPHPESSNAQANVTTGTGQNPLRCTLAPFRRVERIKPSGPSMPQPGEPAEYGKRCSSAAVGPGGVTWKDQAGKSTMLTKAPASMKGPN